ncbi:peroxisome proliferator-activated receptor gamma coactivator 1-beta-like [Poeciliopsis prolifica]|uniref:peroxisome proliferator-activated receptor gamma coactivator 1-beta-like n=1 Tax=Poeciliopsis prolifica TaxID=188132 RepID=UPI002413913A|nr:peroxisome proliferator-activated receptor gamma coactivator 1-beta-like [Poeciliopsis prolifica]XP_054886412.1 peroxisome proliferator-activated receptor gamma coactivator 1-beta-like [Poeciliopsis prolifica]
MADCAPLLDEELSSFVFSYLTENSGSQYGEEEVCSDRLDTDFPDIDLSQLDTSDFDSVNCLSELQWCTDQPADVSPASIHYSTADELFEIEEENAALLAALTDSLDGMVDAEVGGLSVFPTLEEEPSQEEEEERSLPLSAEDFSQSLGAETEDLSLLKKLLLTPPNVPSGIDVHKDGVQSHRYSNRSLRLRPVRPLTKSDLPLERKPRAVRPTSRLCTELHRHLTTAQDTEDAPVHDTDEGEEEEEDEDSESEEDEEEEGEEEEEESSSSEVEGAVAAAAGPAEPTAPQFSSEKELQSVVELITYMHTYCLPMRKQQGWDRKDRDLSRQRTKPDVPRPANTNSHSRVVLVSASGTSGSLNGTSSSSSAPRRLPFARRREMKANSLLRELLQQSSSFDVSKPYRLHSPPYAHSHSPSRATASAPCAPANKCPPAQSFSSILPKPELLKDSSSLERRNSSSELQQNLEESAETSGSFSVRRSRRLASFPSRFAKRLRPTRAKEEEGKEKDENHTDRLLPTQAGRGTTTEAQPEKLTSNDGSNPSELTKSCCHEKRACLCLPLNPKSTGEPQFSTRPYEQTLSVDLCGTAGLTPPTTPPHKSVEDELFKPTDGGKCGSSSDGGGGSESVHPASNTNINITAKGSTWLSRSHHQRKLPEQTELYAQLRRMGQAGEGDTQRTFGDHDYCALSLGESRKRSAAMLGAILQTQEGSEGDGTQSSSVVDNQVLDEKVQESEEERLVMTEVVETQEQQTTMVLSSSPPSDCQSIAATPPVSEEEAERSSASRSPSPILHMCPDSPSSKTDSSENSESCTDDNQENKDKSDEENCQVFYIHNLPSRVTENMLRRRFQVFGNAEDCKVIICNEERCGVIKIRQSGPQRHRKEREIVFQNAPPALRRLTRKRYIDLDEAGPGPVKSKYDALDFDTLLKEAQKSLHR